LPIWLNMNYDVWIVRVNLFSAFGDQMSQHWRCVFWNILAVEINDLAFIFRYLMCVEQVRYFSKNMRVSLAQTHDAFKNEKDFCTRWVIRVRKCNVMWIKQVFVQFKHHFVNVECQQCVNVYFGIVCPKFNQIHVVGFVSAQIHGIFVAWKRELLWHLQKCRWCGIKCKYNHKNYIYIVSFIKMQRSLRIHIWI